MSWVQPLSGKISGLGFNSHLGIIKQFKKCSSPPKKQVDNFSFSILKLIKLTLSQHNANFKTPSNNTADTYWKHILMVLFVLASIGTKDD